MSTGKWNNRIVGHGEEAPSKLLASPKNWRIHPTAQQEPLHAALESLGWIQDVIVNLRSGDCWPPGERNVPTVVDGHLRITLALQHNQPMVPVKYVDLSPDEENMALLTLDPLAAMAIADKEKLDSLLREMPAAMDARLQEMMAGLANREGLYIDRGAEETSGASPWERVGNAAEGVLFTFGDISCRLSVEIYERFEKNCPENNLAKYITDMIDAVSSD